MKKAVFFLVGILLLIPLSSCVETITDFEPVNFLCTGMTLKPGNNVTTFHGTISSSETEITFVAIGDNDVNGFLSEFNDGEKTYDLSNAINDYDDPNKSTVLSGPWGSIEFLTSEPYTTKVVISENKSSSAREFKLYFGCCYTRSDIIITQEGK